MGIDRGSLSNSSKVGKFTPTASGKDSMLLQLAWRLDSQWRRMIMTVTDAADDDDSDDDDDIY